MIVIFAIKIYQNLNLEFIVLIVIKMYVNYAVRIQGDYQKLIQNYIKYVIYAIIICQILSLKKIFKMISKEKSRNV